MKLSMRSLVLATAMLVAGAMTMLVTPTLADDFDVHQFGAVSYLDDSGFYGVVDAPMSVDPAMTLEPTRFDVAVDNSISAFCVAGSPYMVAGGYCESIASNKSIAGLGDGGGRGHCPAGEVPNPSPPPACIPDVD